MINGPTHDMKEFLQTMQTRTRTRGHAWGAAAAVSWVDIIIKDIKDLLNAVLMYCYWEAVVILTLDDIY